MRDPFLEDIGRTIERLDAPAQMAAGIAEVSDALAQIRVKRFGETLIGVEAYEYLAQFASVVEQSLARHARNYSADRWLWYIRMLPDRVLRVRDLGTLLHDRFLIETVASIHAGSPLLRKSRIPIDDAAWRRVLRFCGQAFLLFDIYGALRASALNTPFRIGTDLLPTNEQSASVAEAIALYERRLEHEGARFAQLGVMTELSAPTTGDKAAILIVFRSEKVTIEIKEESLLGHTYFIAGQYHGYVRSLHGILAFLATDRFKALRFDNDTFFALFATLRIALVVAAAGGETAAKLLMTGSFTLRNSDLATISRAVLPDIQREFTDVLPKASRVTTIDELAELLGPQHADLSRLMVGPVLIKFEDETLFNVAAASQRLFSDLEFPPTTDQDAVHEKGSYFETELQNAINARGFGPPEDVLSLRGRTLKLRTEKVTDLDAFFVRGSTLVIVSAKSYPFTRRHAAGEHRAIRNTITSIEKAVREVRKVVDILTRDNKGDNYDLRQFDRIDAIVCTPHVMLVPIGECTEEIMGGLRRYVSAAELTLWLDEQRKGVQKQQS